MNDNNYESEIRKVVGEVEPIPSINIVEVKIERGQMLELYAKQLYTNLKIQCDSEVLPLTEEDLLLYFDYLLEARICHVRKEKSVRAKDFQVKIPCFIHFVLSQIGECEIASKQVIIKPARFERHSGMNMDIDEIRAFIVRVGSIIEMIAPKSVAKSFPSSLEGNPNFMCLTHVENVIRSDNATTEPVLVLASSLLNMARLDDMLTTHISYGNRKRFESTIIDLSCVGMRSVYG